MAMCRSHPRRNCGRRGAADCSCSRRDHAGALVPAICTCVRITAARRDGRHWAHMLSQSRMRFFCTAAGNVGEGLLLVVTDGDSHTQSLPRAASAGARSSMGREILLVSAARIG